MMQNNNYLKQQQKIRANEILFLLDVYEPYRLAFLKDDKKFVFESYIGFEIEQDSQLYKDIIEFENKYNGLVFAVTHEVLDFGECFSYLYIPRYKEEWGDIITYTNVPKVYNVYCYVQNKTYPELSEFGSIGISNNFGGLCRCY